MSASSLDFSTSLSLIRRAQAVDPDAWDLLARLYGPLIYSWGRRQGLQNADAADLVQTVFVSVWRGLLKFSFDRPDATFRGWLRIITRNAVLELSRKKPVELIAGEHLQQWPDPATELTVIESSNEDLFRQLPQRALEIVRDLVDATTWDAFWRVVVDDQPVNEVAQSLAMSAGAVRQAKYRVLLRLRELLADQ